MTFVIEPSAARLRTRKASGYQLSPRSGMVSLDIAPGTLPSVAGGVDDHHITIVYLGKDVDDDLLSKVLDVAADVALRTSPLSGTLGGIGTFAPSDASDGKVPVFVKPDIPGIQALRPPFQQFNASQFTDFKPHATLAYIDPGEDELPQPVEPTPVKFDRITVHRGNEVFHFPFRGRDVNVIDGSIRAWDVFDAARVKKGYTHKAVTAVTSKFSHAEPKPHDASGGKFASQDKDVLDKAHEAAAKVPKGHAVTHAEQMRDDEYRAHRDHVEHELISHGANDMMRTPYSTHNSEDRVGGIEGAYTQERKKLQDRIVNEYMERAKGVPKERRAIITAGLGGAGKSTVLRHEAQSPQSVAGQLGIRYATYDKKGHGVGEPTNFVTLNPDDIKERMAELGAIPKIDQLSPMEASPFAHEEASMLTERIASRLQNQGTNVIHDVTLNSVKSGDKRIDALRSSQRAGYHISGVMVDVSTEQSLKNAEQRHRGGQDRFDKGIGQGGRYVPSDLIRGAKDPSGEFRSKNRAAFETLKSQGKFDQTFTIDNEGYAGKIIEHTGHAMAGTSAPISHGEAEVYQKVQKQEDKLHRTDLSGDTQQMIQAFRDGQVTSTDFINAMANREYAAPSYLTDPDAGMYHSEEVDRAEPGTFGEITKANDLGLIDDATYDALHKAALEAHQPQERSDDETRDWKLWDEDHRPFGRGHYVKAGLHEAASEWGRGYNDVHSERLFKELSPAEHKKAARKEVSKSFTVKGPRHARQLVQAYHEGRAHAHHDLAKEREFLTGAVGHMLTMIRVEPGAVDARNWKNWDEDHPYIDTGHHHGGTSFSAHKPKNPFQSFADALFKGKGNKGVPKPPPKTKEQLAAEKKAKEEAARIAKVNFERRRKLAGDYADRDMHAEGVFTPERDWRSRYGAITIGSDGRILLREPLNHYDGFAWTFPKGHPDSKDEHPTQVALRESEEETGLQGRIVGAVPGGFSGGTTSSVNHYYVAHDSGAPHDPKLMNGETSALVWATPQQADRMMQQGTNEHGVYRDRQVLRAALEAHQKAFPSTPTFPKLPDLGPPPPKPEPPKLPKWTPPTGGGAAKVPGSQTAAGIVAGSGGKTKAEMMADMDAEWEAFKKAHGIGQTRAEAALELRNWAKWRLEHPYVKIGYHHAEGEHEVEHHFHAPSAKELPIPKDQSEFVAPKLVEQWKAEAKQAHEFTPGSTRANRFEAGYVTARAQARVGNFTPEHAHELSMQHDLIAQGLQANQAQAKREGVAAGFHAHSINLGGPKTKPVHELQVGDVIMHGGKPMQVMNVIGLDQAGSPTAEVQLKEPGTAGLMSHLVDMHKDFEPELVSEAPPKLEEAKVEAPSSATAPVGHLGGVPKDEQDLASLKKLEPGQKFSWGETVPAKGTNGGQWYEDANGQGYFLKGAQSDEHAMNEVAGSIAYREAGLDAQKVTLVKMKDGHVRALAHYRSGITPILSKSDMGVQSRADARKGYGMDALMSHYDLTGLVTSSGQVDGPNLFKDKNGHVVRLDLGGTGRFRAQGGHKASWKVGAWDHPETTNDYDSIRQGAQGKLAYGTPQAGHSIDALPTDMKASLDAAADFNTGNYRVSMLNAGISHEFANSQVQVLQDRQKHLKALGFGTHPNPDVAYQQGHATGMQTAAKMESDSGMNAGDIHIEAASLQADMKKPNPYTNGLIDGMHAHAAHMEANPVPESSATVSGHSEYMIGSRLEYHEGTSNKAYESVIHKTPDGSFVHTTRYGSTKPGAHVTENAKEYPSYQEALSAHVKITNQKLGKGYSEVGEPIDKTMGNPSAGKAKAPVAAPTGDRHFVKTNQFVRLVRHSDGSWDQYTTDTPESGPKLIDHAEPGSGKAIGYEHAIETGNEDYKELKTPNPYGENTPEGKDWRNAYSFAHNYAESNKISAESAKSFHDNNSTEAPDPESKGYNKNEASMRGLAAGYGEYAREKETPAPAVDVTVPSTEPEITPDDLAAATLSGPTAGEAHKIAVAHESDPAYKLGYEQQATTITALEPSDKIAALGHLMDWYNGGDQANSLHVQSPEKLAGRIGATLDSITGSPAHTPIEPTPEPPKMGGVVQVENLEKGMVIEHPGAGLAGKHMPVEVMGVTPSPSGNAHFVTTKQLGNASLGSSPAGQPGKVEDHIIANGTDLKKAEAPEQFHEDGSRLLSNVKAGDTYAGGYTVTNIAGNIHDDEKQVQIEGPQGTTSIWMQPDASINQAIAAHEQQLAELHAPAGETQTVWTHQGNGTKWVKSPDGTMTFTDAEGNKSVSDHPKDVEDSLNQLNNPGGVDYWAKTTEPTSTVMPGGTDVHDVFGVPVTTQQAKDAVAAYEKVTPGGSGMYGNGLNSFDALKSVMGSSGQGHFEPGSEINGTNFADIYTKLKDIAGVGPAQYEGPTKKAGELMVGDHFKMSSDGEERVVKSLGAGAGGMVQITHTDVNGNNWNTSLFGPDAELPHVPPTETTWTNKTTGTVITHHADDTWSRVPGPNSTLHPYDHKSFPDSEDKAAKLDAMSQWVKQERVTPPATPGDHGAVVKQWSFEKIDGTTVFFKKHADGSIENPDGHFWTGAEAKSQEGALDTPGSGYKPVPVEGAAPSTLMQAKALKPGDKFFVGVGGQTYTVDHLTGNSNTHAVVQNDSTGALVTLGEVTGDNYTPGDQYIHKLNATERPPTVDNNYGFKPDLDQPLSPAEQEKNFYKGLNAGYGQVSGAHKNGTKTLPEIEEVVAKYEANNKHLADTVGGNGAGVGYHQGMVTGAHMAITDIKAGNVMIEPPSEPPQSSSASVVPGSAKPKGAKVKTSVMAKNIKQGDVIAHNGLQMLVTQKTPGVLAGKQVMNDGTINWNSPDLEHFADEGDKVTKLSQYHPAVQAMAEANPSTGLVKVKDLKEGDKILLNGGQPHVVTKTFYGDTPYVTPEGEPGNQFDTNSYQAGYAEKNDKVLVVSGSGTAAAAHVSVTPGATQAPLHATNEPPVQAMDLKVGDEVVVDGKTYKVTSTYSHDTPIVKADGDAAAHDLNEFGISATDLVQKVGGAPVASTGATPTTVIPTTAPPEDFVKAFNEQQKLTNLGKTEALPQKANLTESQLQDRTAYSVAKERAATDGADLTAAQLQDRIEAAQAQQAAEISPSGQAASLGAAHGFQEALATVGPQPDATPVRDLKTTPEYANARADAQLMAMNGSTSRELYAKAGPLKQKDDDASQAKYLGYHEIAEEVDQAENEKPMVDVEGGHAPLDAEQTAYMANMASAGNKTGMSEGGDLEKWAYDQGRALGINAGNSALDNGLTASDVEAKAREEDQLVQSTTGLLARKHAGIAKGLHRVAEAATNGDYKTGDTYKITTSAKDDSPKPDVKYHGPMSSGTGHSGYPVVHLNPTQAEKSAIKTWTTDYRFGTQTSFIRAINNIMQGKTPTGEGAEKAKTFMRMCAEKSTPSTVTIYRGTAGDEFSPGQINAWRQALADGKPITFSMPVSSCTYSSGVWSGKNFRYVIDPGALTADIGQFGNHVGEVETVTGGMMEVYEIESHGGTTYIHMRQKVHYVT